MANEPAKINISINIPESEKGGKYSNLFNVTTTSGKEVIIDFVFINPNDRDQNQSQTGTVVSRIVMSADSANALKMLLESQIGKIKKE